MKEEYQDRARGTVDAVSRGCCRICHAIIFLLWWIGNIDIKLQIDWTVRNNVLYSELAATQSAG